MPFDTTIDAFAAALGEPSAAPPAMTRGRFAAPDTRRFSVYRNNVAVGLIGALEARYPASRRVAGDEMFRSIARAFIHARKPRSPVMIAYGADFSDFVATCEGTDPRLADLTRLENAWVEAYHAADTQAATIGDLAGLGPNSLTEARIAFHPAARILRFSTPAASIWASAQGCASRAEPVADIAEDALVTRPDADVRVRVLPPLGYDFAAEAQRGRDPDRGCAGAERPGVRLRNPSGRIGRIRRRRLHHARSLVMNADAWRTTAHIPSNPVTRATATVFALIPAWLPLLVLRLTLARPFFASGLTRWDGWFTLSFGTKILFTQEYKLHVFGAEIPFPAPEFVAAMASTAEIVLPILLAFGFLTRWAALGLLCMTAVIQLTYPDAWPDYHLPWAAMALAIMTFGPGVISLDRLAGLDGNGSARRPF